MTFNTNFFDQSKVIAALDKETRNALAPLGAEIRTKAKRSMRPARRIRKSEVTPEIAAMMGLHPKHYRRQLKTWKRKLPYKSGEEKKAPRTRSSKKLKRLLFFGWDPVTHTVVAGPTPFGTKAAKTLEEGGQSTITVRQPVNRRNKATPLQAAGLARARAAGRLRRRTRRPSKTRITKKRITIKPHPYMKPQLTAILPRIPAQFKGLIR